MRRAGYVRIEVEDVLDAVDDDDLLDEVRARKLSPASPGETVDLDIVREAFDELLRGRSVEARAILERLLFPKWKTRRGCETEYAGLFQSRS
jgi:hypothetical protein